MPLVVLFGENGADEADDGGVVGEDPDDVGASLDLAVQPFNGIRAVKLGAVLGRIWALHHCEIL